MLPHTRCDFRIRRGRSQRLADDLSDLIKRVPGDMNTVTVINVREINKSPRAMREKWRENFETEYLAGAMAVPPWVTVVVIGSELHPRYLAQSRSLALIPTASAINSSTVAKRENGVVQTVDDLTLVLSPQRGYFGFPASGITGISSTMPRQEFARWVRWGASRTSRRSRNSCKRPSRRIKAPQILVAMDLKDCARSHGRTGRLAAIRGGAKGGRAEFDGQRALRCSRADPDGKNRRSDQDRTAFRVQRADERLHANCQARLAQGPRCVRHGDSRTAGGRAAGRRQGRRIVGRAVRHVVAAAALRGERAGDSLESEGPSRIKTPMESAALAASLRYYRAANSALDDLRAQGGVKNLGDLKGRTDLISKNYVRSATLFDSYAGRIEKLPLTNVDSTLVQYGTSVAAKLRAMAASLRGAKVQLEVYDSYKSTTWAASPGVYVGSRWGIGVGGGGGVAMSTNVQELSNKQAELVNKLEPERAKLWSVLQSDRSTIRREMLEKYKIDFDQYKR